MTYILRANSGDWAFTSMVAAIAAQLATDTAAVIAAKAHIESAYKIPGFTLADNQAGTLVDEGGGGSGATAEEIATAVGTRASTIDGSTPQEAMQYVAALLCGKVRNAGSGQETFTGIDDATDRVVITVDNSGNRLSVSRIPA